MARYSGAYSGLISRFGEIEAILQLARSYARLPATHQSTTRVNALCRSGVVLLSSHIEGYIEDLGKIVLDKLVIRGTAKSVLGPGFRYYLSRDLIKDIGRMKDPGEISIKVVELFTRDGHIWDSNPNFIQPLPSDVFIQNFSNPTHDRIAKFFSRFGYTDYRRDLNAQLAANANACINMIDQVIEQRNKIAHGDAITTGTPTDLSDMLDLVKLYCRHADFVAGNWFSSQNCPMR